MRGLAGFERGFRITAVILGLLLIISAGVQFNDPDPLRWVAIYAGAALVGLWVAFGRLSWIAPALLGGVSLAWAVTLLPGVLRSGEITAEVGRETGGLLLVTVWMLVAAVLARLRMLLRSAWTPPADRT